MEIFEEYSYCPECGLPIVNPKVENNICRLDCECGWNIEIEEEEE